MRTRTATIVFTLILTGAFAPMLITSAHAIQGCQPTSPQPTCYLYAQTNVPSSDGTVMVRQDGNNALTYALPHTFAFQNGTTHFIQVMTLSISGTPSGARYLWNSNAEWIWHTRQWTPTANMTTPLMIYNYTQPNDMFTAEFDKQFQYSLTFQDVAGNPLTPAPSNVTLGGTSTIITSSYSNQWLPAGSWTVTQVSWEGYDTALYTPVGLDLTTSSQTVAVTVLAYSASVKVVNNQNGPISGVSLAITFANSTSRTYTTNAQGTVQLGEIPYGSYSVQVTYQGQTQAPVGETAVGSPVSTITLSTGSTSTAPVVSAVVLLTIFGVALFLILLAIKVRKPPPPPQI